MADDMPTHGDFKEYYDRKRKRHIWVLGYFGGGSIHICDVYRIAVQYAKKYSVPVETICAEEILKSRRYKGFKFVFSTEEQAPSETAEAMDNVFEWLTD